MGGGHSKAEAARAGQEQNHHCQYEPPPEPKRLNPIETINQVQQEFDGLNGAVLELNQTPGHVCEKRYRYLDEMLTRCLLKLDNVDTQGQPEVRAARKELLDAVISSVAVLESNKHRISSPDPQRPPEMQPSDIDQDVQSEPVDNQVATRPEAVPAAR